MTDLHEQRPISRIQLMVLARLSDSKPPTQTDIARSLRQADLPMQGPALLDCVNASLTVLQHRAFAITAAARPSPAEKRGASKPAAKPRKPSKRSSPPRFTLTDEGHVALQSALNLKATPPWREVYDEVIPALLLKVAPGTAAATAAFRNVETMVTVWLKRDPALGEAGTLQQLCDQVVARALGMPSGQVTDAGIRAYALARHCGVDGKADITSVVDRFMPAKTAKRKTVDGELRKFAIELTRKQLGVEFTTKDSMIRALQRYWITQQDEVNDAYRAAPQWVAPIYPLPRTAPGDRLPGPAPQPMLASDPLLAAVHEVIPTIGSDGRYGRENVFVSALWQRLAGDRRIPALSLDGFKRWLLDANREQLLDLARADLVDAMDPRLVEESEIEDLGMTFHFVVDRRQALSAPGQVNHAR
jgi:hypothetical protein